MILVKGAVEIYDKINNYENDYIQISLRYKITHEAHRKFEVDENNVEEKTEKSSSKNEKVLKSRF